MIAIPSSKPIPLTFNDLAELREQLNFIVSDIYSKLDFTLQLDGKGVIVGLKFGGLGQNVSGFDGLLYLTGGASGQLLLGSGLVFDNAAGKLHFNVTAKGDILAATGNQTMALLPIGAAGQVLSVGGAHATGLQWAAAVLDTLYDANTILKADADNTPIALTVGEQTLVGRITGGVITALSTTQIRTLINVEDGSVALATVKADADIASAISLKHARQHAITATADHTSAATAGKMLKADASGLPIEASNTDTEVASAVSLKHATGGDTALGAVGTKDPPIDADLAVYRDSTAADALVTSTWTQIKAFLKTYFDTLYVSVTGRYRYAAALADGDEITLPTITGNWSAHGFIYCAHASTGVISDSAEFEFGSTGEVQIIRGSSGIEAGGATAGKVSLGPVADANPVKIKNNIGGGTSRNVMITLWYN